MNPMQIIGMLKNGGSIESIARSMAKNSNNPVVNNLISQIDSGNKGEVNKIINNLMQESGMKENIQQFANMIGFNPNK